MLSLTSPLSPKYLSYSSPTRERCIGSAAVAAEGAVNHAYAMILGVQMATTPSPKTLIMTKAGGAEKTTGNTIIAVKSHTVPAATTWIVRLQQGAAAYVVATCRCKSRRAIAAT